MTIVTHGWSNMRNEHLVNYIALIPNRKPLFYGYKDATGFSQTSHQIAGDIIEVIENIGQEKAVAVGAGTIIEQKYPSIFANGMCCPCVKFAYSSFLQSSSLQIVVPLQHTSETYRSCTHTKDFCLYQLQRNGTLNTNV